MSQVKKLQQGNKIPKTYGHLIVDGIDYGNSEELYNAFAQHAKQQQLNQGEFYDQWLTALRNGEDVVFGNGNTVNMKPNEMSEKRAQKRSGWTKFWDDTFDTRRNHFSDAIATARGFIFSSTPETPKQKNPFDTSEIVLNYNDDPKKKGHRIWSLGHTDNQRAIQRVSDAIAGLKDPDNSEFTFNDSLKAAYQIAQNSGVTPEEYANALWGRLQDNNWTGYKNPENDNDLDWLKAFGITVAPYEAPASPAIQPSQTNPKQETAKPNENNSTDDEAAKKIAELEAQLAALQNPQKPVQTTQEQPKFQDRYGLKQNSPNEEGWIQYTFVSPGEYQYNTNRNIATGRTGEQSPAERKKDQTLTFTAKQIGTEPLVYNGINYPIVQEKDTNTYYALNNNMRVKLDQDFVNRWLEGKLTEQDYSKLQSRTGKYTQFVKENGNKVGWLANFFKNVGSGFKTGLEQYNDNLKKSKSSKETRQEYNVRRQKEAYERSIAAGGSKDPEKNRFAPKKKDGGVIKFQYGGTNVDSSPAWRQVIEGGLAALDYGSMAWGRQKVHSQIEKGLKDSLYKKVTPHLQGITTATPIEDAAIDRYDQYVQRGLTTPLTSDNVTNTQNVLTLQANALQGRDQAIRQQSAAALQRQMQNQQIVNQQLQLDAEAENDFRARLSGLRMNLAQNNASLTAQKAQSIQNLAREWRTKFDEQTGKYNQLAYNNSITQAGASYDRQWLSNIQQKYPTIWEAWNKADKAKYGYDFNSWAQSTGVWNNSLERDYNSNRSALNAATMQYYKQYNLAPQLSWMYRDKYAITSNKSGGTLTIKQRNRYKNEPSEDIWIRQNDATHKLVAKLNDNIIRTFLKTLK